MASGVVQRDEQVWKHLKTAKIELTLGPGWVGLIVGLASLGGHLGVATLAGMGGAGVFALGKWLLAQLRHRQ